MNPTLKIALLEDQPTFITRDAAKQHLKIDFEYEDALVDNLILAAVGAVENYTGLFLQHRTVVLGLGLFPSSFELDYFPVIDEAVAVEYSNAANDTVALADKYAFFNGEPKPWLMVSDVEFDYPEVYNRPDAVRFSFTAGMTADTLPKPMYQAMLLMIGDMYQFREDRPEHISKASMALLRPYKLFA